jgi:hypothetical protein
MSTTKCARVITDATLIEMAIATRIVPSIGIVCMTASATASEPAA